MKGSNATGNEKQLTTSIFANLFGNDLSMPFSFRLGKKVYHGFDGDFNVERNENTITATHKSGIIVTVKTSLNAKYGEFEWTVYFENIAGANSEVLSGINGADLNFTGNNAVLHYQVGDDHADPRASMTYDTEVLWGMTLGFEPVEARPTGHQTPYYRLDYGENGIILALGWHGRWETAFEGIEGGVHFTASQYEFCSYLEPGEKIRTPLIVAMPYEGCDQYHAINRYRRWFVDCNLRKFNGENAKNHFILLGYEPCVPSALNEKDMFVRLSKYTDKFGLHNFLWWQDAGWYFRYGDETFPDEWGDGAWVNTGTWKPDTNRLPHGLKILADKVHEAGGVVNLWFECERVVTGSEIFEDTDFCLNTAAGLEAKARGEKVHVLIDMTRRDVREYLLEKIDKILDENNIDIYRQDFNINPFPFWQYTDQIQGENRVGITENKYVQSMYEFYSELVRRHPNTPIDMCASGGRRNDVETMRYASYMHTLTDAYQGYSDLMQCKRLGIPQWFTNYAGSYAFNTFYNIESNFGPSLGTAQLAFSDEFEGTPIERCKEIWEQVNYLSEGDFYPLTTGTFKKDVWAAWEYYDPAYREGYAQFFRRSENENPVQAFKLYGLDCEKNYRIEELNFGGMFTVSGVSLMDEGLSVYIPSKEDCRFYKITQL